MEEKTKYDIMCIERGDVDFLRNVADQLIENPSQLEDQVENIAQALRGIASSAYELDQLPELK